MMWLHCRIQCSDEATGDVSAELYGTTSKATLLVSGLQKVSTSAQTLKGMAQTVIM